MKRLVQVSSIVFLVIIIIFLWFRRGLIFAGGEEGIFFYNLVKHQELISHTWYDVGTGAPVIAFLARVPYFSILSFLNKNGFQTVILQAATFFILMITGTVSVFYLVKEALVAKLKKEEKTLIPFIAGVFYLLNPYSMSQVWGRGLYPQFFSFALTPLFLLLFIKALKEKKFAYLIIANIASFYLASAFTLITQVVVLWVPVFVYFVFHMFTQKNKKETFHAIFYFSFLLVTWFFVHAWWLSPNYIGVKEIYSSALANEKENLGTLLGVSPHFSISYVIRLMQKYQFHIAKTYGEIYSTAVFKIISWLIPIIALFSISYFKKIKTLKFFLGLFFLGLFVVLGANKPFGKIFVWFFSNFPLFQAFRNPYEKFGLVFLLACTPFFALGLVHFSKTLSRRFSNLVLLGALVVTCGIFVWPIWTGDFAGKSAWVKVPDYYRQADNWLAAQGGEFRIIQMPLITGDGIRYNWEFPYKGIESGDYLFSRLSIGRNISINKKYYNVLLQRLGGFRENKYGPDPDLSKSDFASEKFYQELAKLGVSYIVLHKDVDYKLSGSPSPGEAESYLENQEKIEKVKSFGELDIYKVDIDDEISLVYSPGQAIEYLKKSPTEYIVTVRGATEPFEIYFLNLYNDGWKAFVDGREIIDHYEVFSYANAWKVNREGNFEVLIKYIPQNAVDKGWRITRYSLLTILILFLLRCGFTKRFGLRVEKKVK